jgi:hypothetical protein
MAGARTHASKNLDVHEPKNEIQAPELVPACYQV